jgi:two-component system, NtrC family, nitrogen regulation sensor histidine kinase NtrY
MASKRKLAHETEVLLLALLTGLPGTAAAILLLIAADFSGDTVWALGLLLTVAWVGLALLLQNRVVRPLQTFANMVAALLEGDYTVRFRGARADDALGLAMLELNQLAGTLRESRIGALEAAGLLRKVIAEIDVAIFTFDDALRLRLVNRSGERLLARPAQRLLGREANELGLGELLKGDERRIVDSAFPGGIGRYEARRSTFRQEGKTHQLLVLADLSKTLRAEERQAWKRLVRVLSHEINNSLAPIKSLGGSLQALVRRNQRADDSETDLLQGLEVITSRADALGRFMSAYAQLARLPAPNLQPVDVGVWVRGVAGLETRLDVQVRGGPGLVVRADADQLEQLLINLVRNAADAALEMGGGVRIGWARRDGVVEVWVDDDGPGIKDSGNLFVPFFTTKPAGTGIGLALSRQIAEAHGGSLTLENRIDGRGARARLRLPL